MSTTTLNSIVTTTVAAVLMACLVWIAVRLCRLLEVRTRGERTRGALLRLDYAVTSVVRELHQVAVGTLKSGAAGKRLGARIPAMLHRTAHARVKQYLGAGTVATLATALSIDAATFEKLIASRIEVAVYELKHQRLRRGSRPTATARVSG